MYLHRLMIGVEGEVVQGSIEEVLSHLDSWSDPNGGSEPGSGRETIYWDSLPIYFFLTYTYTKELPPEGCPSKSIHIYRVSFTYTYTKNFTFNYIFKAQNLL